MSKNLFQELGIKPPSPIEIRNHKPFGELTLGEIETQLRTAVHDKDPVLTDYAKKGGACYPNIRVPTDIDPKTYARPRSSDLLAKQTHPNTTTTASISKSKKKFSNSYVHALWKCFRSLTLYVPFLQVFASVPVKQEKSPERPVVAFDWHWKWMKFALVLKDQGVYFYNLFTEEWSAQVLRHEFHREIQAIKWRPQVSDSEIAVACKYGVCLWDLEKKIELPAQSSGKNAVAQVVAAKIKFDAKSVEQLGVCTFLRVSDFDNISCITWSQDGSKLIVGSHTDHRIVIWQQDAKTKQWKYSFRVKFDGGCNGLVLSPDGNFLVSFSNTSAFRVWDTSNWKASEKWRTNALAKNLESVKCAQWSKGSRHLLVSLQHSDVIHVIRFDKLGSSEYSFAINLHQYTRTIKDKAEDQSEISQMVKLCGNISSFVLDSDGQGERLCVAFEDSPYLALMRCDFDSPFTKSPVLPVGFIRGGLPHSNPEQFQGSDGFSLIRPTNVAFWGAFKKGALAAICWNTGAITFCPLYYANNENYNW